MNQNPTVESVRKELRAAIFWTLFHGFAQGVEGRPKGREELQHRACFLVEFGTRSGLITPDEGNDWLDAVWERRVLAEVAMKYDANGSP